MKLSDQLRRDFIGKYDCPDAIVEIAADVLEECEKVLDMALFSSGPGTNQRIEAMLAKLREQEKADG